MRFGIITAVFDGCLGSLELLFREIHHQTHRNWIWMLCSNGHSEKISEFVDKKNYILNISRRNATPELSVSLRSRMIYLHTEYEELHDRFSILTNVSKRIDYCIHKLEANYVLLLDADAKILDSKMFEIIDSEVEAVPRDICIYKVKFSETHELPIFPISYGRIDALNYCISTRLAKKAGFPTTINSYHEYGNDYWFFKRCYDAVNGDYVFIDKVFGEYNGNNTYLNMLSIITSCKKKKILTRSLRFLKVLLYRSLLNPFDL